MGLKKWLFIALLGCLMPPCESPCLLNLLLFFIYLSGEPSFLSNEPLLLSLINYISIPHSLNCLSTCLTVFHFLYPVLFQNVEDHVAFVITVPTALAIFLAVFVLVCIESIFKKLLRVFSLVIWACLVAMGYLFMFSGGIICPWDQVRHDVFCGVYICFRGTCGTLCDLFDLFDLFYFVDLGGI